VSGLADYPRAALCGPDAPDDQRDRCTDHGRAPDRGLPVSGFTCEGARTVDGARVLCTHTCHGLPDRPGTR
jgi:hypothetical protein